VKLRQLNPVENSARIVLAERLLEDVPEVSLKEALAYPKSWRSLVLAVGPEGGWTDDELRWFAEQGWVSASLGRTILRTETAAIAAVAIAIAELE
jgi:16S rRNA (uracil1498-N3)-methyltransferase